MFFFPKEVVLRPDNSKRVKAVIPHVLFIRTSRDNALALEDAGRRNPERSIRFWIYRYPTDNKIQVIPARSIDLLRLTRRPTQAVAKYTTTGISRKTSM